MTIRTRFDAVMTWAVGVETAEVSTLDLARYAESTHNWAVHEGLGSVVAHAADGLDVRLRATVTAIDWSGESVRVESSAGTLAARAAIITVPTSVLAHGAIRFTPALPAAWREAAENLPLGVANKVFFRLPPGSFQPGDARHFIGRTDTSRTCSYLLFPARQPLLLAYFGGDLSKELEARGELEQFARDELRGIFGPGSSSNWAQRDQPPGELIRARWVRIRPRGRGMPVRAPCWRSPWRPTCSLPARPARRSITAHCTAPGFPARPLRSRCSDQDFCAATQRTKASLSAASTTADAGGEAAQARMDSSSTPAYEGLDFCSTA